MAVEVVQHGRVLVITLAREEKRNAVDGPLSAGIEAGLARLDDDPELWAGVITGGPRMFSAGTDLRSRGEAYTERGGEYGLIRRDREKPLIAAVEGFAYGGGFEIALACDLVVAASNASFGLPEVKRGVVAASGALFRLTRALPRQLATELLVTGEDIGAERLHALGFVNVVTEPGGALDAAVALAERICGNAPTSVRATLRALRNLTADADVAGWRETEDAKVRVRASEDHREGVAAFFEKRPPVWFGH